MKVTPDPGTGIDIECPVEGDGNGPWSLLVDAGNGYAIFNGDVGGTEVLESLEVRASGFINLHNVWTLHDQIYNGENTVSGNILYGDLYSEEGGSITFTGPVTLGGSITVGALAGGDVSFNGTIDTNANPWNFIINAVAGDVLITGSLGGNASPADVSITGNHITIGEVYSTGSQTYNAATSTTLTVDLNSDSPGGTIDFTGPVVLGADIAITTTGDINFDNGIEGLHSLSLNASTGSVGIAGEVGMTQPLSSLLVVADSVTLDRVQTSGSQDYQAASLISFYDHLESLGAGDLSFTSAVEIGSTLSIITHGGTIHFLSTVDGDGGGSYDLTLDAGSGVVLADNDMGASNSLGSLTASGSAITLLGGVNTDTNQSYLFAKMKAGILRHLRELRIRLHLDLK